MRGSPLRFPRPCQARRRPRPIGGWSRSESRVRRGQNVRFGSKADMCSARAYVRFTPESDLKCDIWNVATDVDWIAPVAALRWRFTLWVFPDPLSRNRF